MFVGIIVIDFFIILNVDGEDIIKINLVIKSNLNELKFIVDEVLKIVKLKDEKIDIGVVGGKVSIISDYYKVFVELIGLDF